MSQRDDILAYLKRGRPLTPLEALVRFGVGRLAARILELRQRGYTIDSRRIEVGPKTVAEYRMTR